MGRVFGPFYLIMKNEKLLLLIIPFVLSVSSCTNSSKSEETKNYLPGDDLTLTSIEMCDHYGECTLIQFGTYDLVIDSGAEADAPHINEVLTTKITDKTIDMLIVTHPHGDHIGGILNGALSNLTISTIVDYGYIYDTNGDDEIENSYYVSTYVNWRNSLVKAGTTYYSILEALKDIPTVTISKEDDCYLKWLKNDNYVAKDQVFPNSKVATDNPNTTSVSCYVQYKHWNIVLCGDVESMYAEASIVKNHSKLFTGSKDRVMLKATHHGSSSSMGSSFLDWAHPDLMYVSAAMVDVVCIPNEVTLGSGKEHQSHPDKTTLKRMTNRTDNIYWNGINGDLIITIDGVNDANVMGLGRNKNYYKVDGTPASIDDEKNVKMVDSAFYKYYTNKKQIYTTNKLLIRKPITFL